MKIAIIGAGAIGRLFAWFLAESGVEPILVGRRPDQAEALRREGLTFVDLQGQEHHLAVAATVGVDQVPSDLAGVMITVKSYDTKTAADLLGNWPDIPVLSLQNGIGNGEVLANRIAPGRLAVGLTTCGATSIGETTVEYRGAGQTILGDWSRTGIASEATNLGPAAWWRERLTGFGHTVKLTEDIRTEVWRKAMVNIGINPFTALFHLKNGELLQEERLLRAMERTVAEAEQVARAEGVNLQASMQNVLDVCRLTATNQSSMLQDRLHNRKTEIESLCGVIAKLGNKHHIPTPNNALLLEWLQTSVEWSKKDLSKKIDMLC